jgi:hypothetical protein
MRTTHALIAVTAVFCLSTSAAFGQAPVYDIRAELAYHPTGTGFWVVQIRNVGPTIPGPVRAEYSLSIPAGAKIPNWTLNGWQCSPAPPLKGSMTIGCRITLTNAWAAGTILSNQLFHTAGPIARPGAVAPKACVRARLLLPDASGNFQPAAEINPSNNSACA